MLAANGKLVGLTGEGENGGPGGRRTMEDPILCARVPPISFHGGVPRDGGLQRVETVAYARGAQRQGVHGVLRRARNEVRGECRSTSGTCRHDSFA